MDIGQTQLNLNSPVVNFALSGLSRCWLSEHGRWSHVYHLDGRSKPNESIPSSDVFYTLNALLGLARVPQLPPNIQLSTIFYRNIEELTRLPVRKYAFGVGLWAAAELQLELPTSFLQHCQTEILDRRHWHAHRAQDLGMILTGVVTQAKRNPTVWTPIANDLFSFLSKNYWAKSGLFLDAPFTLRRRFASFASQTYLILACYTYGEFANCDLAIDMANTCCRKLVSLQGPNGEWPWFFDAINGVVVDFYEVYSVHQYGMAPAFLELAERNGVTEARSALLKGFQWVLGNNQLQKLMIVPQLQLTIRSQARRGELSRPTRRALRALSHSALGRTAGLIPSSNVELRPECRSYELGWLLWSFGRRADLPELTHHKIFQDATNDAIASA